jgi:hypothetical protein
MIYCPTWRQSRPARRDDPDRSGPGHGVPDAHAQVGHGAHQRRGEALAADDTVQVYDPTGALPKNQDSWR